MRLGALKEAEMQRLLVQFEQRLEEILERLASCSADGEGVTRLLYTPEWLSGQQTVKEIMEQAGLEASFDEVGNLFGKLKGATERGSIMTGSHIDTVVNGGKYDGAYGIAAGIVALGYLKDQYGMPLRALEVVSLCEEEGSRFPMAYWGSGAITGERSFSQTAELTDKEGIFFAKAMADCGFGEGSGLTAKRRDIDAFIELHIEQGIVLESERKQVGIVNAIVGQRRFQVEVAGEASHAGTTPMNRRKDALEGAAAIISRLRHEAMVFGPPLVATAGTIRISPNAPNVVPGYAAFTVDIRHADRTALESFCAGFHEAASSLAGERGLGYRCREWFREDPVPMDKELGAKLRSICEDLNIEVKEMSSGAGHDAQMLARLCPSAMLFVPSRGGVSHAPQEYTSPRELAIGVLALTALLYQLGYEEERR
ncbi:Zn-dependent hydrolase [Paenibacillus oryzae]|nr:Zn-dependent hydrolase [Paenibacillus oryzae]